MTRIRCLSGFSESPGEGDGGSLFLPGVGARVGLVLDDQARAGSQEFVASPGRLDEIGGDHYVGMAVDKKLAPPAAAPHAGDVLESSGSASI